MQSLVVTSTVAALPSYLLLTADVRAATAGDIRAFERLIEATKRTVTSVALAVLRDVRASEDVAQEAYLRAWRDLKSLNNPDSFLPWIRQLTRNQAITFARTRRRQDPQTDWKADSVDVASHEPGVLDRALAREEELILAEAIEALPDDTREVLTLFYREGQSVRHVAELLGLSEDAVKKRLERARTALKEDVRARFEDLARRTAPTAALTASIIALITFGAPSTAAAATVAGTSVLKGVFGVALGTVLGPLIGVGSGLFGNYYGMKGRIATAIDETERAALVRHRNRTTAVTVAIPIALAVPIWAADAHLIGHRLLSFFVLVAGLGLLLYVGYSTNVILPRIMARRREIESARDRQAFERRERRARLASLAGFVIGALGVAYCVYVVFTSG